jgi:hypothetical protein
VAILSAVSVFGQNQASVYLLGQTSGTARNPASWSMPMVMTQAKNWDLMWMGQAFVVNTQQSGPRGEDRFYSANWGMLGAARTVGKGAVMVRAMVSLEPATVRNQYYPLLFQTGETANGRALVDGQHPHEAIMELGIQYARPFSSRGMVTFYYAPVGDAAMGAVAFPHRASAMETPQATLGHHWLDATHIVNNLATVGVNWSKLRFEASGFRGREPNENRWDIDTGGMDSWSTRVVYQPAFRWLAQASYSRITSPETLHPGDVQRTTASVQYTRPLENGTGWSSTIAWGRNYKTEEGHGSHALLAETLIPVTKKNFLTGRFEWSQRDELFPDDHDAHAFDVVAYTGGYTRELGALRTLRSAIGFNLTGYQIAQGLRPIYGNHPMGVSMFVRFRLQDRQE